MQNDTAIRTNQIRSSQRGTVTMAIIALFLAALPALSAAQGTLSPVPQIVFLDASGNPINNGKICTYAAGTTTPLATYSDQALTTANANPIRTNSAGRPTTGGIYLSATSYKFTVLTAGADGTCSTGTTVYTQDNVAAVPATAVGLDITGTAGEALTAGDVVYLSAGDGALVAGRWYKADADNTYASSTAAMVGIVPNAITSGASGSIRIGGRITGLSGLTAGEQYYASATAGALTATPPTNTWFVGKADTTTSLLLSENQGGARLPDSDGTHSLVLRTTSNLTADRLLTLVTGDAARTVTIAGDATIGSSIPSAPQGRCSGTTGVAVTTTDVTAATTLYFALYKGNQLTLYDGAKWVTLTYTQLSVAVPATTSTMYDVFVDYTAGVPALELVAWSSDTARATALATQDGVYVQTADADSLYVCSFRTTGVSGQTEDSFAKRYIWNYYNRVERPMRVLPTADSWQYTLATYRQAGADAANQLDFVIGVSEDLVEAELLVTAENGSAVAVWVGIGLDSTTALATGQANARTDIGAGQTKNVSARYKGFSGVGRHTLVWLERSSASGTTTWLGDNAEPLVIQSGMHGSVKG